MPSLPGQSGCKLCCPIFCVLHVPWSVPHNPPVPAKEVQGLVCRAGDPAGRGLGSNRSEKGLLAAFMWVWIHNPRMACPGKWKQRLKPAVHIWPWVKTQIVPPVNIPIQPLKEVPKWVVNSPNYQPKWDPKTVLTTTAISWFHFDPHPSHQKLWLNASSSTRLSSSVCLGGRPGMFNPASLPEWSCQRRKLSNPRVQPPLKEWLTPIG